MTNDGTADLDGGQAEVKEAQAVAPPPAADPTQPLRGLSEATAASRGRGLPPVDRWNPEFCGDIDMRIGADGIWYYQNSPIGRKPLVRLFSTLLRKDEDGKTYLVTPVEKVGITVDDAHFLAVSMIVEGEGDAQVLRFVTNCDDEVTVDADHPMRFVRQKGTDGLKPYILVRGRLEALLTRSIFYDLVELGVTRTIDGADWFGVWSSGQFFPMAPAAEIGL
jgi:hypothetical protein